MDSKAWMDWGKRDSRHVAWIERRPALPRAVAGVLLLVVLVLCGMNI